MNTTSRWIFCTLGGLLLALFAHTAIYAQSNWTRTSKSVALNAQAQQTTQKAWLAESVVASRESAMGRSFDPIYRASLKNTLASLSMTQLESVQYAGSEGSLGMDAVGDSSASLIYTPVRPCRVFDTRSSTAGILVGNTQRNFYIAGNVDFTPQGGSSGGCSIPFGPATSVMINFAAVTPTGAGNLRAWAVANPQPAAPFAAVMNFSADMWALANGLAVPICDPAATSCAAGDLRLQADVSSVHVVGDVVGYFRKLDLPAAMPMGSQRLPAFSSVSGDQYAFGTVDIVLPHNGSCLVTCNIDFGIALLNDSGFLVISSARRDVAAAKNEVDDGWGMDVPVPSVWGSASKTYTWDMTGGRTYRFGCHLHADGDFTGKPVFANVSWICR
jgi:hypothetical protein